MRSFLIILLFQSLCFANGDLTARETRAFQEIQKLLTLKQHQEQRWWSAMNSKTQRSENIIRAMDHLHNSLNLIGNQLNELVAQGQLHPHDKILLRSMFIEYRFDWAVRLLERTHSRMFPQKLF